METYTVQFVTSKGYYRTFDIVAPDYQSAIDSAMRQLDYREILGCYIARYLTK